MIEMGFLALAAVLLCAADFKSKKERIHPLWIMLLLPAALNVPLLAAAYMRHFHGLAAVFALIVLCCAMFYFWVRLNLFPVRDHLKVGRRCRWMIGGVPLIYAHFYGIAFELLFVWYSRSWWGDGRFSKTLLTVNFIYAAGCCVVLGAGGLLRMFCTSRRLSVLRRVVMLLTLWVPLVNWIVWWRAARLVKLEYEFEWEKKLLNDTRREKDLCATQYPVLMLHGVAFRDFRWFHYWGRIPAELKKNGAALYYGNQEALGTVEQNGRDIAQRIEEVLKETGAEKVNLVCHSKGGLDARYAVTHCGAAEKVASVTTISTPHHGCKFADTATKLPEKPYRLLAKIYDDAFRRFGDQHPDFYSATKAFCTEPSRRFNEETPDMPGVFYQSYASVMKNARSDLLLSIPYWFIRRCDGENDGLVTIDSARWGVFQGVFRNDASRGISHGDIIDLHREDYPHFDVRETYVSIFSKLKEQGF